MTNTTPPYSTFSQKLRFALLIFPMAIVGGVLRASGWSELATRATIVSALLLAFAFPFVRKALSK